MSAPASTGAYVALAAAGSPWGTGVAGGTLIIGAAVAAARQAA